MKRGLIINPKTGKLYFAKQLEVMGQTAELALPQLKDVTNEAPLCKTRKGEMLYVGVQNIVNPNFIAWNGNYSMLTDESYMAVKVFEVKSALVMIQQSFTEAHKEGPANLTTRLIGVVEAHLMGIA